jgi:SAM-dependent methyltransferase
VTEPRHLTENRTSYDTVAVDYAKLVRPLFQTAHLSRGMLGAFAGLVAAQGGGPVADIGCGPGHVTAYLHGLGLDAFGIDLSPGMVEEARRAHPELRFHTGTMTALELPDGELAGIVAWYSIIHTPPEELSSVFAEFHRTLAPGGHLVLGFHVGNESRRKTQGYGGHEMSLDVHLLPPDHVTTLATRAGLTVHTTLIRETENTRVPQACVLLRKPGT